MTSRIRDIARRALLFSALSIAALPSMTWGRLQAPTEPERPNIVVFLADDLGYLDVEPNGSVDARTPNLARLAAEGLGFNRAYVASPSCGPSRAALLTGQMPARNLAEANHARADAALRKLPSYLQAQGYQVVSFGKVAHYQHTGAYGFDYFAHDTFHDHAAVPAAIRWLNARTDTRPLALFIGSNWPHVPWPVSGDDFEPEAMTLPARSIDTPATRSARASYHAAVARMDQELGDVIAATDKVLGQKSVFMFTSDHGAQWPFAKWNLYDAGTRVPLFVRWRGVTDAGTRTDAMVSWVDILPTLVELSGGTEPTGIDGRSFASALLPGNRFAGSEAIFTTHNNDGDTNVYPARAVRTDRWKYISNLAPAQFFTTHIDQYAPLGGDVYFASWREVAKKNPAARQILDAYFRRPAEELYDLKHDSDEMRNLAGDPAHTDTLVYMRTLLSDWRRDQGDSRPATGRPHLDDSPLPPRVGGGK